MTDTSAPARDTQLANAAMIEIRDVSKVYRRADGAVVHALSDINLEIHDGEFVCIIGPSGCGKTTLLQLMAGLALPSSGRLWAGGHPVIGPGPDRGVVFQKDSVFPWKRVIDNVQYGLKCRGVAKDERLRIARHYLAAVGLPDVERSWPRELSGGMLKRVAVATVFANDARILLLDEPFGALDYVTKHHLHDVVLKLWGESGDRRTIVFVTHDVDEALTLADRILVMRAGQVVGDYCPLLPRPRTADMLAQRDILALKHALLRHLGLEGGLEPSHETVGSAE